MKGRFKEGPMQKKLRYKQRIAIKRGTNTWIEIPLICRCAVKADGCWESKSAEKSPMYFRLPHYTQGWLEDCAQEEHSTWRKPLPNPNPALLLTRLSQPPVLRACHPVQEKLGMKINNIQDINTIYINLFSYTRCLAFN